MSASTKFENAKQSGQQAGEHAKQAGEHAKQAGQQGAQGVADKVREVAGAAVEKTREGLGMAADKAREVVGMAADKAREGMGALRDSAGNMATAGVNKADDAVSAAGRRLEDWGDAVRKGTPHEGFLGQAGEAVASSLESSGKYLEDHGVSGMVEDVTEMIKRNPIPALFVGIGIGFLLAKATSPRS